MNNNKVLSVVYGIALFIALISVVGLLYNGIEMLTYTNFYQEKSGRYELTDAYKDFQEPTAIALLIASSIGIIGVCAGIAYLFVKKPLLKIIFLTCVAVAVVAAVVAIILISSWWQSYYFENAPGHEILFPHFLLLANKLVSSAFAMYSTALSSVVQSLVCFMVVAALLVYDFVKGIRDKKKETATQEVVVEEITE